jgi:hypothetical protein
LSVGQITAMVLAVLCMLIGFATQGLGLWLFVVLAPVFILLAWPGRWPTPEGYLPAMTGCGVAAAVAVIVVCSIITFVAVCFPIGFLAFSQSFENPNPPLSASLLAVSAWGLGSVAAAVVAWMLVRRIWPRAGRR